MNTAFSLKRIGYILRADLIEHKKNVFLYMLLLLGVFTYLLHDSPITRTFPIHYFVLFVLSIIYCRYVGHKIHRREGLFLTLPATTEEKYVALLLEGTFIYLSIQVLFWVSVLINKLLTGAWVTNCTVIYGIPSEIVIINFFAFSLLFLFYVAFKKYAMGLYILTHLVTMGLFSFFFAKKIKAMLGTANGKNIDTDAILMPFYFLKEYLHVTFLALIVLAFLGAYFLLKRKQTR